MDEVALTAKDALFWVNNTWMLIAAFLVFIMHLGFACLESGLTQSKNTANILFKNTAIVAIVNNVTIGRMELHLSMISM